jgi:recombination protein RecA
MPKKRKRVKLEDSGAYFDSSAVDTFSSGCTVLDCVLGGGWATGRIGNIVGDKSTGKTLLAIEACANFARQYPESVIKYIEAEAAFDVDYAETLGLPSKNLELIDTCITVEDVFSELEKSLDKPGEIGLFVVDSLDALTVKAEQDRKFGDATYGTEKARQLSELFRRLVRKLGHRKTTVLIVSQLRDKIGVTFGKQSQRAGGRSLDFYASQVIWLAHLKRLTATKKKATRAIGVKIRAKCEKNKVGPPFRECEFPILFNFGIEDLTSGVNFLVEEGTYRKVFGTRKEALSTITRISKLDDGEYSDIWDEVKTAVVESWKEIEDRFIPQRRKY